jgi:hypothetical protein
MTRAEPIEPPEAEADAASVMQFSAAVHPLQLSRETYSKPFDLGLGYVIESFGPRDRQRGVHGAGLELGYYPWRFGQSDGAGRVGVFTTAEVLTLLDEPSAEPGYGTSAGLALELTGYAEPGSIDSHDDEKSVYGYAAGQWAIGVYGAGGMREVAGERYWTATFGVSGRLPFLAGVVIGSPDSDIELHVPAWGGGNDTPSSSESKRARHRSPPERTPARVRPVPERTPADVRPRDR